MKTLKINGSEYRFEPVSGKVLSTNKNLETKVSGHGGGGGTFRGTGFNRPVKITSKQPFTIRFLLKTKLASNTLMNCRTLIFPAEKGIC